MLLGWGKLDAPNKGDRQRPPCGRATISRWRESTTGDGSRNFSIWTKIHHGEHWLHTTLHSTSNKYLEGLSPWQSAYKKFCGSPGPKYHFLIDCLIYFLCSFDICERDKRSLIKTSMLTSII